MTGTETKLFDPADGFAPLTNLYAATDASVAKRGDQWWMFLAGKATDHPGIQLFSACLPPGAPLAAAGWKLTAEQNDPTRIALLSSQEISKDWDLKGGRHCPSYVRGWDPQRAEWMERIYYAGGAYNVWGPYAIGFLEWDGAQWVEQPAPVFAANEEWEHGSVYEPNLIYADGLWKMWYVAGSNQEDYIVQGYAESPDGRTNWSKHQIVFAPEEKVFDFCVLRTPRGYEAVFSRVWLAKSPPPSQTGLWWSSCSEPSSNMADWSRPVQIMTAEDRGWHTGPWKPSLQYGESIPEERGSQAVLGSSRTVIADRPAGTETMFVFFDGIYQKNEAGPFPFVFTLGCLQIARPSS